MMPSGFGGFMPESDSLFDATTSLVGQVCVADPERCGCPDVYQTDYRGPINTTRAGQPCMRWDDEILLQAQTILLDGWNNSLSEENIESNFCRNPDNDPDGTWCYVGVNGYPTSMLSLTTIWNYCNVPVCDMSTPTASPSDSVIPTSSSRPTITSSPSDLPSFSASPTPIDFPTITFDRNTNCRRGPAINYFQMTSFLKDHSTKALGRNADSSWLWVISSVDSAVHCWVIVSNLKKWASTNGLPTRQASAIPCRQRGRSIRPHGHAIMA